VAGIFWQPQAIDSFAQSALLFIIIAYLVSLRSKPKTLWFLILYLGGFAGYVVLGLLKRILLASPWLFYAIESEQVLAWLGLVGLLRFVYLFPKPLPQRRGEAVAVWGFMAFAGIRALLQALEIISDQVPIYPEWLTAHLWALVVLARQAIRLNQQVGGEPGVLAAIFRPQGKEARQASTFLLAFIVPATTALFTVLRTTGIVSSAQASFLTNLTIILTPISLALAYLNHAPHSTNLMTRLVGASLVVMMSISSLVGNLVEPSYRELVAGRSGNVLPNEITLRFTPNTRGGYDITTRPYRLAELGRDLGLGDDDEIEIALPFSFRFYGREWASAHINENGVITFGDRLRLPSYGRGEQPTIAVRLMDLFPEHGGAIYAQQLPDQVIVTWYQRAALGRTYLNTFQAILRADGSFDLTYANTEPEWRDYALLYAFQTVWPVGVFPGNTRQAEHFTLRRDLELSIGAVGLVEDTYLRYRQDLHQQTWLLWSIAVVGSLLVLFGIPFFMRVGLSEPLSALLDGVQRVNEGDLSISVPVEHNDEIGFLAASFNEMVRTIHTSQEALQQSNAQLEQRVLARTAELSESRERLEQLNEELKNQVRQLEAAMLQVKTLRGLLPVCANCKKVRDDAGYWHQVERYIESHSEAQISHGICPDCARKLYPDIVLEEDQEDMRRNAESEAPHPER